MINRAVIVKITVDEQGATLRAADVDSDRAHDGVRLRRGSSVPSAN
jgi:hypothetical protein